MATHLRVGHRIICTGRRAPRPDDPIPEIRSTPNPGKVTCPRCLMAIGMFRKP